MTWSEDHLEPVERLLFQSKLVKVGTFRCGADHPCFPVSESLDNDVFVLPQKSLWIRRDAGDYLFVEPGAILMHRAGSTLERRRTSDLGDQTCWFGVQPDVFVETLRRYELSTREMGGALIADLHIRYRLALLLNQLKRQPVDMLAIEEEVMTLFIEICERRANQVRNSSAARLGTAKRQRRIVDLARSYLDEHLTETVSLETVASAAGTSLYHLCRVFREQTGLTMHTYRMYQRLGHVLDRLVNGRAANLTELALDHGFSSHSHLSRVFQKQMGMSPSALRGKI